MKEPCSCGTALLSASENRGRWVTAGGQRTKKMFEEQLMWFICRKQTNKSSLMPIFILLIQRGLFLFPQHWLITDKELLWRKKELEKMWLIF